MKDLDPKESLKKWIIQFLRHRDMFFKKIIEVKEKDDEIIVKYKDKDQLVLIEPDISMVSKSRTVPKGGYLYIVTFNTEENLKSLISGWDYFTSLDKLSIYFVNPFVVDGERKWIVSPFTHDKVTEKKSLRTGLKSLFEGVLPVKKKQI